MYYEGAIKVLNKEVERLEEYVEQFKDRDAFRSAAFKLRANRIREAINLLYAQGRG